MVYASVSAEEHVLSDDDNLIERLAVAIKEKRYEFVINEIKQELKTNPEELQLYSLLEEVVRMKIQNEILSIYESIQPMSKYLAKEIGLIYMKMGEREKAIDMLEEAIRLGISEHDGIYNILGYLYAETGDYDKAITLLEKALKYDKDNISLWQSIEEIYSIKGARKKAKKISNIKKKLILIDSLIATGNAYVDMKDYISAIEMYQQVIKLAPECEKPYLPLAEAYRKQGNISLALYNYLKAAEVIHDDDVLTNIYGWLGVLYLLVDKKDMATPYLPVSIPEDNKRLIPYLAECLTLIMDKSNKKNDIGLKLLRYGKLNEAIKIYEEWLSKKRECDNLLINMKLGVAYSVKEMYSKALSYFLKVIQKNPATLPEVKIANAIVKIIKERDAQ
jgi:tetratricopeptide (TPR) repeat protein